MIPYWATVAIGLVLLVLGWLWGRAGRKDMDRALDLLAASVDTHAERLGEVGARLAAVEGARQAVAPPAPTAWPPPAPPETVQVDRQAGDTTVWLTDDTVAVPAVGGATPTADHPPQRSIRDSDDLDAYLAGGGQRDAEAALADVRRLPEPAGLELDDDPAPDDKGDDDRDEPGPPLPQPVPAFGARFGWSAPVAPAGYGVMPDARLGQQARMLARRMRLRQWTRWPARWWQQVRTYAAERWEAVWPAADGGWAPGELTGEQPVVSAAAEPTRVLPVVARVAAPRNPRYQPRHDFAEVPPSLRRLAELLPVTVRCTVIARAVSPASWRPRTGTRAGLELWAAAVARRHGRRPMLGTFGPKAVLP